MLFRSSNFDDTQKASITNQVLAKINKFIAEESTQKGKFIFPFLVRYAYRLYDGFIISIVDFKFFIWLAISGKPHWEREFSTSS